MTRSKLRKIQRENLQLLKRGMPIAGAMLAGASVVQAQQPDETSGLEEVVVSAQKRNESLQDVPLSIQAIGEKQLGQLKVDDFGDYVKFLPNVSYQTLGPGLSRPYMRGVASGENANHSGPLPSVGVYLDEQPITTINGPLDVQIYDIARVEVLAGPQGTLYGASSQAGTIRIITNKPNPDAFDAGYELTGTEFVEGDLGYAGAGFPQHSAQRERRHPHRRLEEARAGLHRQRAQHARVPDVGHRGRQFRPRQGQLQRLGQTRSRARRSASTSATTGRITPSVMAQKTHSNGTFGYDPTVGDLKVAHALPETADDKWTQAALTVQGKIGNWDITYAGAHLKRNVDTQLDYADYSFFYDTCCGYGSYMYDNDGALDRSVAVHHRQRQIRQDEPRAARSASPAENRWRVTLGAFTQKQTHGITQDYQVANLTDAFIVPGQSEYVVAHGPGAHRQGRRVVRRVHVRHHRQAVRDRGCPILQIRQFAVRLFRIRRGLQRHDRRSRSASTRPTSAARPASTSTRKSRKTATPSGSTSRITSTTM